MGPSFDFDRRMTRNFGELGAKVNDGVLRAFGESASLLPEPPLQFARRHTYMVSSSANEVQGIGRPKSSVLHAWRYRNTLFM